MKGVDRAPVSHAPHSTGSTSQDLHTQFSCFTSFLTSNTPITAVLTRPPQYYPVQLTGLYWCTAALLSLLFQSPVVQFPMPCQTYVKYSQPQVPHIPPPRIRTVLKSSESSGQHLGSSFPSSEEAARKLRLAIYLCKAHMTHNLLWECK